MADRGAKLAEREAVQGKLEHDVREAECEQDREAERVVIEIERGRRGARGNDQREPLLGHLIPVDDLGFDEPVEVVIGVDESEQAGEPGIEP